MSKPLTAKRRPGRPATGQTPKRYFRMEDGDWKEVVDAAKANDQTASDYIRHVLLRDARRVNKDRC